MPIPIPIGFNKTAAASGINQTGLKLWLEPAEFDTGTGWPDKTGNHGTGTNTGLSFTGGFPEVTGNSQVVTFADASDFDLPGDFTICHYIGSPANGDKIYIGHGNTESAANGWFLKSLNQALYFIGVDSAEWNTGVVFDDSLWTFIAYRRSGTTISITKNGAGVAASTTMTSDPVNNSASFRIGHGGSSNTTDLVALYGQILLYDRALSDAEILSNFNFSKATYSL